VLYASDPELVDPDIVAVLKERADEVEVWVSSERIDDPAIAEGSTTLRCGSRRFRTNWRAIQPVDCSPWTARPSS